MPSNPHNIVFLRVAWMNDYQGVTEHDIPIGAGWYVAENNDGGEVENFRKIRGRYYGYAEIQNGRNMRIERLGAAKNADKIDGVLVVFFATNPIMRGQYVVGWYGDATVYRTRQTLPSAQRGGHDTYICSAAIGNAVLLPLQRRWLEMPKDGPGETNVWYADKHELFKRTVVDFITRYPDVRPARPRRGARNWGSDLEHRRKVEDAAMTTVANYYEDFGFVVEYVHKENLGWDLEATKAGKKYLLEVKGLSGEFHSVDLTPNEFRQSRSYRASFRLCVVSNALDASTRTVDVYSYSPTEGLWVGMSGKRLEERVIEYGRFSPIQ